MQKKYFLLIFLVISFCTNAQLSAKFGPRLDDALKDRVELLRLKGAAASIVFRDGSVWSSAEGKYGTSDLTTDLLYDIGSNTKTMVGATILLLSEEGKIRLSDTLYKFISPQRNVSFGITIEQLLNHTSGLFNYTNHANFGAYVNNNWNATVPIPKIFSDFVDPPTAQPGSSWDYSNTNFILLGMVIEEIEKKPLHTVFKERLYTPLGLTDSYLAFFDSYTKTHLGTWLTSGSYLEEPGKSFMTAAWAAGAVIQTPEDLAMWAFKLYRGDVLEDSSHQKMLMTVPVGGDVSYGLAMFKDEYKGRTYYGHGGTTLQNSEMQYSPTGEFSVATIVIEQGKGSQANLIQNTLIDIVETEMYKLSTPSHQTEILAFNIYPNPSSERIYFDFHSNSAQLLQIHDNIGKLIYTERVLGSTSLSKAEIGSGFYTATLLSKNGASTKRFIIQ